MSCTYNNNMSIKIKCTQTFMSVYGQTGNPESYVKNKTISA